ncbi:flagellar motor switch protein FliN [Candidatus Margulisiibacteriota bacterium]
MEKQKEYINPLEEIDPVMEQAFSMPDEEDDIDEEPEETESDFELSANEIGSMPVSKVQFPDINKETAGKKLNMENIYGSIPVNVAVELGRSKITMKEIYEITEGSIIELEKLVGEPLDLVVNGQVIAQGEVVAIDNNYGLRITNIIANIPK